VFQVGDNRTQTRRLGIKVGERGEEYEAEEDKYEL
jgi:hypothetical protein